jgi:plastocyanin domain-containing protein
MRRVRSAAIAWVLLTSAAAASVALGACDKKSDASTASSTGDLRVTAGEHGFAPSSLALQKGPPGSKVTVTFVRITEKTCATEVVFPDLGVKKPLPLNQPVPVNVPTDTARTLAFQCGMGMYTGALLVK